MLDFYVIKDEQTKPNSPGQIGLQFAGGLDDETFGRLKSKSIIDDRFDYYSDFRWGTSVIKQINEKIMNRHLHADTDVKALLQIIQLADKNQSGLIAYAD